MVSKGKGGRICWEIGIATYLLLYIKQMANNRRLYNTGNSSQYSAVAYMGKESKGLCIRTTDSLSCTAETNTTFKSTIPQQKLILKTAIAWKI